MKHLNIKLLLSVTLVSAMGTSLAYAVPKPNVFDGGNRWLITAYNDASPSHTQMATQGICFRPYAVTGTHIRGQWYSDTYPDWNGVYSQEGDQVFLHGDYAHDVGHDGIAFEIVTRNKRNEGAGHWTEWRENGSFGNTIVFANAQLKRVGKCFNTHPHHFRLPIVSPRYLLKGGVAEDPMQEGQESLDDIVDFPIPILDKLTPLLRR